MSTATLGQRGGLQSDWMSPRLQQGREKWSRENTTSYEAHTLIRVQANWLEALAVLTRLHISQQNKTVCGAWLICVTCWPRSLATFTSLFCKQQLRKARAFPKQLCGIWAGELHPCWIFLSWSRRRQLRRKEERMEPNLAARLSLLPSAAFRKVCYYPLNPSPSVPAPSTVATPPFRCSFCTTHTKYSKLLMHLSRQRLH